MEKNIKKNFIWNIFGLTFNSFNSLFFLIIVKYVNGIDKAGIFTYAFSICCLFYMLSTYFSRTYQVANYEKYHLNDYFSCRIVSSVISFILLLMLSIISGFSLYKIAVILLIMLFRVIESISDCLFAEIQRNGNLYKAGISLTLKAIIGLLVFLLIDVLTKNILISLLGLIIVNFIIFILYDKRNINNIKLKFKSDNIKPILVKAFPVFIFSFLGIYLANSQKYVLTYYADNSIQTIFGIIIMPATVLSLVGNYLILPFINVLTTYYKDNKYSDFIKLSVKIILFLLIIGVICIIGCYFLGIPVLNLIYGMELNEYKMLLMIIMIASVLFALSMILSNLLTVLDSNKIQSVLYLISSIISTAVSIYLISNYGIDGAVYSYLISFIINTLLYLIVFVIKAKSIKNLCYAKK